MVFIYCMKQRKHLPYRCNLKPCYDVLAVQCFCARSHYPVFLLYINSMSYALFSVHLLSAAETQNTKVIQHAEPMEAQTSSMLLQCVLTDPDFYDFLTNFILLAEIKALFSQHVKLTLGKISSGKNLGLELLELQLKNKISRYLSTYLANLTFFKVNFTQHLIASRLLYLFLL